MTADIQSLRGWALSSVVVLLSVTLSFGANQLVSKDTENKESLDEHKKQATEIMQDLRSEMWTRREQDQFNEGRIREFDSHVNRCEAERDNLHRELEIMRRYLGELKEDLRRLEDRYQLDQINNGGIMDDTKTAQNTNLNPVFRKFPP